MNKKDKHEFALYAPDIQTIFSSELGTSCTITDQELVHRTVNILRLIAGETVSLFDGKHDVRVLLTETSKKYLKILTVEKNLLIAPQPAVQWLLPILERDALEKSIYILTALGAASIQLITTRKVHRSTLSEKELARLQRIAIAAAEQSKQYLLPTIIGPIPFETYVARDGFKNSVRIFFDAAGEPCAHVLTRLRESQNSSLVCLIGPEGDLTTQEKEIVAQAEFVSCALTPSILRAEDAVTVGMGILRSLL